MHTSLASGLQEQGWEAGLSKADSILTLRTILEAEENYPSRATALWGDMTGNGPPRLGFWFFSLSCRAGSENQGGGEAEGVGQVPGTDLPGTDCLPEGLRWPLSPLGEMTAPPRFPWYLLLSNSSASERDAVVLAVGRCLPSVCPLPMGPIPDPIP